MKRLTVLLATLLLGLTTLTTAATISQRVDSAQARIEQGVRSGSLTRREADRLRDELRQVRRDEARARADGRLSPHERDRLDAELTRLERHIAQLKHNDETRHNHR